uniref:acetyl-CoA carboxylase carboxyltransferase beta subunit n=1 Tax=Xyris indica TaxID=2919641 RepID=UPI001F12C3BD|nr:acetyl-CoA carboxylase carboxyltransferase beta subunit [Xyris indica]ULQ68337.1 acetyl-CoA carboxylase carboxyltransferase beta subunit [Xyris indica]
MIYKGMVGMCNSIISLFCKEEKRNEVEAKGLDKPYFENELDRKNLIESEPNEKFRNKWGDEYKLDQQCTVECPQSPCQPATECFVTDVDLNNHKRFYQPKFILKYYDDWFEKYVEGWLEDVSLSNNKDLLKTARITVYYREDYRWTVYYWERDHYKIIVDKLDSTDLDNEPIYKNLIVYDYICDFLLFINREINREICVTYWKVEDDWRIDYANRESCLSYWKIGDECRIKRTRGVTVIPIKDPVTDITFLLDYMSKLEKIFEKEEGKADEKEVNEDEKEVNEDEKEMNGDEKEMNGDEKEVNLDSNEGNKSSDEKKPSDESGRGGVRNEKSDKWNPFANYSHLWTQCENCCELLYKKHFLENLNICKECGYHGRMSSLDRIELLIDKGTWYPMNEHMLSLNPLGFFQEEEFSQNDLIEEVSEDFMISYLDFLNTYQFIYQAMISQIEDTTSSEAFRESHEVFMNDFRDYIKKHQYIVSKIREKKTEDLIEISEDLIEISEDHIETSEDQIETYEDQIETYENRIQTYEDRIQYYQKETGLTEAVQTGIGKINGIPIAIGVMDAAFIAGSMGSVVGEKITRLIEYATYNFLPLIIVCASGGARMQEGSLSLMQMAKVSSALYHHQLVNKLLYIAVLTSPTTGGVTASFAMLGDIIIAEPDATIAFAGKKLIEEVLKIEVPEDAQTTENLFPQGLFDLVVPRTILKGVLRDLLYIYIHGSSYSF